MQKIIDDIVQIKKDVESFSIQGVNFSQDGTYYIKIFLFLSNLS